MDRHCWLKAALLVGLVGGVVSARAAKGPESGGLPSSDWTALRRNLVAELVSGGHGATAERVKAILAAQRPDGSWPEINYADRRRSDVWSPHKHLTDKLMPLAVAWRKSKGADKKRLAESLHRGLTFWLQGDFTSDNWWWNEISTPMNLGYVALLFEPELTADERSGVIRVMSRAKVGRTGQNRSWLGLGVFMRGLLASDAATVREGAAAMVEPIRVSDAEGLRADGAFLQHGIQQQFGNYGLAFFTQSANVANVFAGTSLALTADQMSALELLWNEGYRWVLWNGWMPVGAMDRHLRPQYSRNNAFGINRSKEVLARAGGRLRTDKPTGLKYYDSCAYGVYRAAGWMAELKMSTSKIVGTETWINGDNLRGGHMADGMLTVYATGSEYADIFPLWSNWRLIPGVTTYLKKPPYVGSWEDQFGNKADSIRVSGKKGDKRATVDFRIEREGLTADKRWSFDERGVTCSGTVLSADAASGEVVTCVEHALAQPNASIRTFSGGRLIATNGAFRYEVEASAASNVVAVIEDRAGHFSDFIAEYDKKDDVEYRGKVFLIYIRHGSSPKNSTYRYRVSSSKR